MPSTEELLDALRQLLRNDQRSLMDTSTRLTALQQGLCTLLERVAHAHDAGAGDRDDTPPSTD